MNYAPQYGDQRDRITQALLNIQNPPPQTQVPPVAELAQGMNMPAVATTGTMASMNAQSPASPSYGGVQAMQGQPQMFPQMPSNQVAGGLPAPPSVGGAGPQSSPAGGPAPLPQALQQPQMPQGRPY